MPWNSVLLIWGHLIDQLCEDFRCMDKLALIRFRGDRTKLVVYLAETHDLTLKEADETLTDWIDFTAYNIREDLAA